MDHESNGASYMRELSVTVAGKVDIRVELSAVRCCVEEDCLRSVPMSTLRVAGDVDQLWWATRYLADVT